MKEALRQYPSLSNCGLNCCLCPRFHTDGTSRCPGCGGETFYEKRPKCGVISCSQRHGVEYCFMCDEYPCNKYDGAHLVDSFITHRNMLKDFEKAKAIGLEAYQVELNEKADILCYLLNNYNDGRRKSFYCIAINLLELHDIRHVMRQIGEQIKESDDIKEKSKQAVQLFQAMADQRDIILKLNKKKPEK